METILVVDDDVDIVRAISLHLKKENYNVIGAYNGLEALEKLEEYPDSIKLIIMDVMMPKLDGLSTLMKVREKRNIPVMILSAKSESTDKILGLSMGADDYVTKPFEPSELVARVHAHLRRYVSFGGMSGVSSDNNPEPGGECYINGTLRFDIESHQLYAMGKYVKLTATETKIIELLMANPGRIFPAEEIYERVWNEDSYACENTVMVHIRRIREKIEINPRDPDYLKVVWGIGYKIEKH